jgi:uridine kinase
MTHFVLLLRPAALLKSPRSRRQRTVSHSQAANKTSTESILRSHTRTIYTAGRPPWYNCAGQQVEPFVIGECAQRILQINSSNVILIYIIFLGICGGSASGKTTVAARIIECLDVPWVTLLSMDSFYKVCFES